MLITTQDDVMVEFIGLGSTTYSREGNGEWEPIGILALMMLITSLIYLRYVRT